MGHTTEQIGDSSPKVYESICLTDYIKVDFERL